MCPLSFSQSRPPASSPRPLHQPPNISLLLFLPTGHLTVTGSVLKGQSDHASPLLKSPPKTAHQSRAIPISHQNFQSSCSSSLTNLQLPLSHFPTCYTLAWFQQPLGLHSHPRALHCCSLCQKSLLCIFPMPGSSSTFGSQSKCTSLGLLCAL